MTIAQPDATIVATWKGALAFDVSATNAPAVRIDCDGNTGPGPIPILLGALAACAASDVVLILEKQRTPLESLEIEVATKRVDGTPRRLDVAELTWRVAGAGTTQDSAERAVALSVDKYCSVRASLNDLVTISSTVELRRNA
jgi:putative redox protein